MKKAILITAISLGSLVLIFGAYCIWGAFDYVNRVPKIESHSPVRAKIGDTLQLSDLAEIRCGGDYTAKLKLYSIDNIYDAKVAADGQSIYVGGNEGTLSVSIIAYGSESSGEVVQVNVYAPEK